MVEFQAAILQDLPAHATYLSLNLRSGVTARQVRNALAETQPLLDGQRVLVGIGTALAQLLELQIAGLRDFDGIAGSQVELPASPAALWLWLRESERGELLHQQRRLMQKLAPVFQIQQQVAAFHYAGGRDLSGYEDGTENPAGAAAQAAAIAADGSSYVAVQLWQHRFEQLQAMPQAEQDLSIGRRRSDNEEIDDAPESAHVKRTAQEDFEPEAFVMRRSMPWADGAQGGLNFVAFATSFAPFEAQLRRMSGAEDGICDALFRFTEPLSTSYFWCPPVRDGVIALNLAV